MKKAITLMLLLVFVTVSFCQRTSVDIKHSSIKKVYLQAGAGLTSSNGVSVNLGIQAVVKDKWTATISYQFIEMDPKNLPADYEPAFFLFFYDSIPYNDMNVFSLTIGKYFATGKKTWITTDIGLSFVNGQKFNFTPQPIVWDFVYASSNYSTKSEDKTGFGVMLKSDFNWAILPYVGLGAGVFANLNSLQSPVGFEIKVLCGWLNTKRKH